MKLPAPLEIYFAADKAGGDAVPLSAFAPDGVVTDEGRTHVGHDAIAAWWRAAKAQYGHVAEPHEVSEQAGLTVVRTQVTGRFPGSPAMLTFAFRIAGGKIAALRIGA